MTYLIDNINTLKTHVDFFRVSSTYLADVSMAMMRTAYPEAETLHRMLRTERDPSVVGKILAGYQA
jgi:hypothetical protein